MKSSKSGLDSPECAELLLKHGADLNAFDVKGFTPIHIAAVTNGANSLAVLLKHGADPNSLTAVGWTALHACLRFGALDCLKLLLNTGTVQPCHPWIDVKLSIRDNRDFDAFDMVLLYNEHEVLHYLLTDTHHLHAVAYIRQRFAMLRSLILCIDNDSVQCFEELLKYFEGCQELLQQQENCRLLLRRCIVFNSAKSLRVLLPHISNVNVTPCELELATYYSHADIFQTLLHEHYKEKDKEKDCESGQKTLDERVFKACIWKQRADCIEQLLAMSKTFKHECQAGCINDASLAWSPNEIKEIYHIRMLKHKQPFLEKIDLAPLNALYSTHNVLHLALEGGSEVVCEMVLKTNVSLLTQRKVDLATPLILATKVACRPSSILL